MIPSLSIDLDSDTNLATLQVGKGQPQDRRMLVPTKQLADRMAVV